MASFSCTHGEMTTETTVELLLTPDESGYAKALDESEPEISIGHL